MNLKETVNAMDKEYKSLTVKVEFPNLYEGQIIDRQAVIEKLKFFENYSTASGMYITDKTYREFSQAGIHFYKWKTIIDYFSRQSCRYLKISFDSESGNLLCEAANEFVSEYFKAEHFLRSHLASPERCCNRCGRMVINDDSNEYICVYCQKRVHPYYTHYRSSAKKLSKETYQELVMLTSRYYHFDKESEAETE